MNPLAKKRTSEDRTLKNIQFIFARHGDTNKADGADDMSRTLKDSGVLQAVELGKKLPNKIDLVISSGVTRTTETARYMAMSATGKDTVEVIEIPDLYPSPVKYPAIDKAFKELLYASLACYLTVPWAVSELEEYGEDALEAIEKVVKEKFPDGIGNDGTIVILVVTHAVCTNAIVRVGQLKLGEADAQNLVMVSGRSVEPGAAFVVNLTKEGDESPILGKIQYITP